MRKLIVLNTLTDQEKERNKKRLWEAAELKKSHTTVPYPARPRTLHTPHSSPPRLNRWSVQQHIVLFSAVLHRLPDSATSGSHKAKRPHTVGPAKKVAPVPSTAPTPAPVVRPRVPWANAPADYTTTQLVVHALAVSDCPHLLRSLPTAASACRHKRRITAPHAHVPSHSCGLRRCPKRRGETKCVIQRNHRCPSSAVCCAAGQDHGRALACAAPRAAGW